MCFAVQQQGAEFAVQQKEAEFCCLVQQQGAVEGAEFAVQQKGTEFCCLAKGSRVLLSKGDCCLAEQQLRSMTHKTRVRFQEV